MLANTKSDQKRNAKFLSAQAAQIQKFWSEDKHFDLEEVAKSVNSNELSITDFSAITKYCADRFGWHRNYGSVAATIDLSSMKAAAMNISTGMLDVVTINSLDTAIDELNAINA
jgi:hypothetical protein